MNDLVQRMEVLKLISWVFIFWPCGGPTFLLSRGVTLIYRGHTSAVRCSAVQLVSGVQKGSLVGKEGRPPRRGQIEFLSRQVNKAKYGPGLKANKTVNSVA